MTSIIRNMFFILALLVSQAHAQTLWGKSQYGMTAEQVKAVFPNAENPAKPSQLGNGAKALLSLPGVQIAGTTFRANFYFLSEKLVQVTLTSQDRGQFDTVLRTFETIEELLRAKYGREIQREVKRGTLSQASATWMSGSTNVSVLAMGVAEHDAILNINYQLRISQEAEKL